MLVRLASTFRSLLVEVHVELPGREAEVWQQTLRVAFLVLSLWEEYRAKWRSNGWSLEPGNRKSSWEKPGDGEG